MVASVAALGLAVLVPGSGVARSGSVDAGDKARRPLRAIFYRTAPIRLRGLVGRPVPRTSRDATVERHLAALKWAWADAAIVPWAPPGSAADRKLGAVLRAIASTHAHVRVAALLDRPHGTEASQIEALAAGPARAPGYLRIGARPAVFVAPADRSARGCLRAAALASGGRRVLAGAGELPRRRPVPQRSRRLVPRRTGCAQHARSWHVPDSPGLLAERLDRSHADAIDGWVAALDPADERIRCPSPAHRLAERVD